METLLTAPRNMPTVDTLNGYNKIGCVKEIRKALVEEGVENPAASDVYEYFKETKHSSDDEDKDKNYLYQAISTLRREERTRREDDDEEDDSVRRRPGRPKGSVNKPPSSPFPIKTTDQQLEAKISLAHLREVQELIPTGMDIAEFLTLIKEIQRINSLVGGMDNLRYIVNYLMRSKK